MISNPMQRKTRNSFLLGMAITLFITGIIITILFLQLKQKNEEIKAAEAAKVMIYTLAQDVKAGQTLTEDMFLMKYINRELVPNNATATASVIESWFLQTKEGESILTDANGFYLDRTYGDKKADNIIEVLTNTGNEFEDSKGKKVATGDFYVQIKGLTEKVDSKENVQKDEDGSFLINTQGNDTITRIYQEIQTGEYYVYKIDGTTRTKEYIQIKNVPVLAKVDMNMNTVLTPELVVQSDQIVTDDTREEQYNMITLPIDLITNDYVDIRLKTPNGQNFIVIAKAQVEIPRNLDGTYVTDTIKMKLREDEILAMSSAIVEAYGLTGSELYATKYVEPAMQKEAYPTYIPNAAVTSQIKANPNIIEIAMKKLEERYTEAAKKARNDYLQQLINTSEAYKENIETKTEENISNSISARQKYLESLYSGSEY